MRVDTILSPQLRQQMKLAPQVIQSIEILQLPMLALVEHIQQELIDNPVLEEVTDNENDVQKTDEQRTLDDELAEGTNNEDTKEDEEFKKLGEMADDWGDYFSQTATKRSDAVDERDRKQEALENTAAKSISLQDYLLGQLSIIELEDSLMEVCENIIYSIDDNGYLAHPLEDIAKTIEHPVSIEQSNEALEIIQYMEPLGVGARDLKECLLLQLDKRDPDYNIAKELILNHLEDVDEIFRFAAGGFRDFTRIASSEPVMWRDICLSNRDEVMVMMKRYRDEMEKMYKALETGDGEKLKEIFERAKKVRDAFCE